MLFERLLTFFFAVLLGGLIGYFSLFGGYSWTGAATAIAVTAAVLYLLEIIRGFKFLKWLRSDDLSVDVFKSGFWDDVAGRVKKMLKQKELLRLSSEESLRQFLAAIQASPNGVLLLDPESRIQWCNQTAARHLGIDPHLDSQQLIGNLLRNPAFSNYVNSKVFDHEVIIEGRLHRANRPHKIGIQIFPYGDGRMLLLSRDVTTIEQAEVMRRDFVANVSHEIRTPLTVLLGFVETLQTLKLEPAEQENYLNLMAKQAFRMKSLVEDLLTLSRLEGSPFPSQQEWISLQSISTRCEEDARGLMLALEQEEIQAHEIKFNIPPDLIDHEVAGSAKELASAFNNLISNALRYTPSGGHITVSWFREGEGLAFSVEDTGPGISDEHLPRLSERFYRIDRSRSRDTGGTGLGLAIVKHVIQRHGGKLLIESKLNQGSKFTLLFPASHVRQMEHIH